ncbi:PIF1-like helicase-domain-containing protein [Lentinula novae-zelandiae]|nr:PIF1-like helicase-domain-containing protein [Lentinula novae-zelandiae]
MFSTLLLFCNPQDPGNLWNQFREYICDDLPYHLRVLGHVNPSSEDTYDYGLYLLDHLLQESGHFLEDFTGMPLPVRNWAAQVGNTFIAEQLDYDHEAEREQAEQSIVLMNSEQRMAFDNIMESVEKGNGSLFFLSGPGGTGKTFIYQALCHAIRAHGWITLCVASTGIAALLLPGGRTAHSMFKIPIDGLMEELLCNIPKQSSRAELLWQTHAIIWDESPMQNRLAFEALD